MTSIYNASVNGTWGVVTKTGSNYNINASLYFKNSTFTSTNEFIEIGSNTYEKVLYTDSSSYLTFGTLDAGGYGISGSSIKLWTKQSVSYSYLYNLKLYGSKLWKSGGSYAAAVISATTDIKDSILAKDYNMIESGLTSGAIARTLLDYTYYFYVYSPNLTMSNIYLSYSCLGLLCGKTALIQNISLNSSQIIRRYYDGDISLVNSTFGSSDWSTESGVFRLANSPTATLGVTPIGTRYHVYVKYTLNIKVVNDKGGVVRQPIIKIIDGQGNLTRLTGSIAGVMTQQTPTVWDTYIELLSYNGSTGVWSDRQNIDYRSFTIKIEKNGFEPYITKFSFTSAKDLTITLARKQNFNQHSTIKSIL